MAMQFRPVSLLPTLHRTANSRTVVELRASEAVSAFTGWARAERGAGAEQREGRGRAEFRGVWGRLAFPSLHPIDPGRDEAPTPVWKLNFR